MNYETEVINCWLPKIYFNHFYSTYEIISCSASAFKLNVYRKIPNVFYEKNLAYGKIAYVHRNAKGIYVCLARYAGNRECNRRSAETRDEWQVQVARDLINQLFYQGYRLLFAQRGIRDRCSNGESFFTIIA